MGFNPSRKSSYDESSLDQYLKEVSTHKLLTGTQEVELGKRAQQGQVVVVGRAEAETGVEHQLVRARGSQRLGERSRGEKLRKTAVARRVEFVDGQVGSTGSVGHCDSPLS